MSAFLEASRTPAGDTPIGRRTLLAALGLVLLLGSACLAYAPLLRLGILGWDSYPMILSSRAETVHELFESFSEELMGGLYPHARYFRPVANLSLAIDHAVWGLEPFGYHLTDLLLLLASLGCVWALGRSLFGSGLAPLLAVAFVAHHPLQIEALPVTARRPDTLAVLFTLLALMAIPEPGCRGARLRSFLAALLPALAVSAKEAGIVALPLVFLYRVFGSREAEPGRRIARAARDSLPAALAVAIALAIRVAVLGGLGGPSEAPLAAGKGLGPWLATLGLLPKVLLVPRPIFATVLANRVLALAAWMLLAGSLLWVWRTTPSATVPARWSDGRRIGFLVCWLLVVLALPGLSGGFQWWYGIPAIVPLALLLTALARAAATRLRGARRIEGAALAAASVALVALPLRFAPLIYDYPEWRALDAWQSRFLAQFRSAVEAAEPGASLRIRGLPIRQMPLGRTGVQSAWGLSDYSVQAFAALAFPDAPVRVALSAQFLPADPAEIRVALTPPAPKRRPRRPVR